MAKINTENTERDEHFLYSMGTGKFLKFILDMLPQAFDSQEIIAGSGITIVTSEGLNTIMNQGDEKMPIKILKLGTSAAGKTYFACILQKREERREIDIKDIPVLSDPNSPFEIRLLSCRPTADLRLNKKKNGDYLFREDLFMTQESREDLAKENKRLNDTNVFLQSEVERLNAKLYDRKNPISTTYGYLDDFDDEFLYGALTNQNGSDMYIFQTERSKLSSETDLMIGMGIQVEIQNNKIISVDIDKRERKPVEATTNFDELEQLFELNGDFPTL